MGIHSRPVRSTRVRRRARLIAILLGGVPLGLGVAAADAGLGPVPDGETVVFAGTGASCTSKPDRNHVSVAVGEWLNLVNDTGGDATVDTGKRRLVLSDGHMAAVKLAVGAHAVRVVPDCAATPADAAAVAVQVLPPVLPPAGTGRPTGGPDSPFVGGHAADRLGADPGSGPAWGWVDGDGASAGAAGGGQPGGPASAFEETRLLSPEAPDDSGRDRLLAVMATVCVFGVTAGIIRAIIAQHIANQ